MNGIIRQLHIRDIFYGGGESGLLGVWGSAFFCFAFTPDLVIALVFRGISVCTSGFRFEEPTEGEVAVGGCFLGGRPLLGLAEASAAWTISDSGSSERLPVDDSAIGGEAAWCVFEVVLATSFMIPSNSDPSCPS